MKLIKWELYASERIILQTIFIEDRPHMLYDFSDRIKEKYPDWDEKSGYILLMIQR